MRYKLEKNVPVLITRIEISGQVITNPPDSMIDEAGIGYQLVDVPAPEYDSTKESISFEWQIKGGNIEKVWTITELTPAEKAAKKNAEIDAQIDAVNAGYEAYKTIPISYDFNGQTMLLKPVWVTEYYGTLQQVGIITSGATFPTIITDATGANFEMTFEQFSTMYLWLVQQAAAEIATVNATLAELEAQKEVVNA